MNSIKILIVENETIIAFDIKRQLQKMGYEVLGILNTGEKAIEFLKETKPDLILMDIQLDGDLDGVDTVHEIQKDYEIPIIYLTSHTDSKTFSRAKGTIPHAYLSKPFRGEDLKHSIALAIIGKEEEQEETPINQLKDCIFIKVKNDWLTKIPLNTLLWIEADGAYCKLKTDEKEHLIVGTLKKMTEKVQSPDIVRVHRSYLVNIQKVDQIKDGYLKIGDKVIPIGRSYKESFNRIFPSI